MPQAAVPEPDAAPRGVFGELGYALAFWVKKLPLGVGDALIYWARKLTGRG
jgi:hypothetical protein